MKNLKKAERAVIALTLLCLFFTAGYFIGRASAVRVISFDRLETAAAPLSDSPAAAENTVSFNTSESNAAASNSAESNAAASNEASSATPSVASQANPTAENPGASEKININTASLETLDQLPGIGPVLAQSIIDYRVRIGGFKNIDQIMDVDGIGEKKFASMKDRITVG